MKKSVLAILSLALVMGGCTRSKSFEKDQAFYQEGGPKANFTGKVERMGQPKKRLVVLNFMNRTPIRYGKLEEFASEELRRNLFLTRRVILPPDVVPRVETKDFVEGDTVRVAQLVREGRRMGVSILVIGRLSKVVFRQRGDEVGLLRQTQSLAAAEVEVKVFDIGTGREIMALGRSGEASSNSMVAIERENLKGREFRTELIKLAIRNAVVSLAPAVVKSVEKMTWEGRIAKVMGKKIYINSGRTSGLVGGDILKVLTPGDDIYDPDTGAYLGRTKGQLKGTVELVDFVGKDAAVGVVHSGGQFQMGDLVRLY